jgi:DNA repair protein RecN (Recombination protein N)
LHIRNLAIIEDVVLEFEPAFTVLTGETGAGKSILIDGLSLALGERVKPYCGPRLSDRLRQAAEGQQVAIEQAVAVMVDQP